MSWNDIKDDEEVGVWFNTELIWILQGKPRNEDEMYHIDDLSGRSDNEALRIILVIYLQHINVSLSYFHTFCNAKKGFIH